MELEELFTPVLEKLPAYANSHMYDVVSYEIGLIAMIFVAFIKDPLKKLMLKWAGPDNVMGYRRRNMLIALLAMIVSEVLFQIFARFSPTIEPITWWTLIVALAPVAYYTIIEQCTKHWAGRVMTLVIIVVCVVANKYYCLVNMNHHKMCYAIKMMVLVFGVAGLTGQFFFKKKEKAKEEIK